MVNNRILSPHQHRLEILNRQASTWNMTVFSRIRCCHNVSRKSNFEFSIFRAFHQSRNNGDIGRQCSVLFA